MGTSVMGKFGQMLMNNYRGKEVVVVLLDEKGTGLTGTLFTAQDDYLQLDQSEDRKLLIPYNAIAHVRLS